MSNFFSSSIGKKVIMSVSGLFLVMFLLVHLTVNALLLVSSDAFNTGAHFMATFVPIRIMEPILAIGFIVHIVYSAILTLQNRKARPVAYAVVDQSKSSAWSSRNMFILGGLVFVFLVIHIMDFFAEIKFGEVASTTVDGVEMENAYALVAECFSQWYFMVLYVIGGALLGLHLSHGFQSGFQSIGLNNLNWQKRLKCLGNFFAILFGAGFALIAIVMFIKLNM